MGSEMSEIISYCGLTCQNCPIFLATRETNRAKKENIIYNIINMCKEHYGIKYRYEDINDCDGCKSKNDRLFFGCKNCKIRKCAIERNIDNCAYCDEYPCEQLSEIFKTDPGAKTRLDAIRYKI